MKNRLAQISRISIFLITVTIFAGAANAQTGNARLWKYSQTAIPDLQVWDRATQTQLLAQFDAGNSYATRCSDKTGGGVAYDASDGNLWISVVSSCGSDGLIHKIPAMGGPDIKTILDPTKDWGGGSLSGISAMDYDPEENVLYAISKEAKGDGTGNWIFKLNPDGGVLNKFPLPLAFDNFTRYQNPAYTLAVARPDELAGRKVLIINPYGPAVDIDTGANISWGGSAGWFGIDADEITGELVRYLPNSSGDISLEDGYRCDCKKIDRPPSETVSSNWPESDLNWTMGVEVSDNDGLVLHDVRLGQRYMAEKISVPYYTLETSALSNRRADLKPDSGSDPIASSQLINYQVFKDDQKLVIQATYLIGKIPSTTFPTPPSCLHITQRYEFYKSVPGDHCEPSGTLPCSRWKPIVKYRFFGQKGDTLTSINIAQRQHLTVDGNAYNTVGLFKDLDFLPATIVIKFARWCNPLPHEWFDQIVSEGKYGKTWDNIHQTFKAKVEEPQPKFLTNGQFIFIEPGCPECVHNHWRWGAVAGGEGDGNLIGIAPTSTQDAYFAIARYRAGEEDPTDYRDLVSPREAIRTRDIAGRNPVQIRWGAAPEDVVLWQSASGHQNSDTFFVNSRFFNPRIASQQMYSTGTEAGIQSAAFAGKRSSTSLILNSGQDELASITADSIFVEGATNVVPFDSTLPGSLPSGYTVYSNLSYDVESEAESSGPYTVNFSVPSVSDQAVFNNLRVFHVEQDPYDPNSVVWVDRTILPPYAPAPDFANRTISASANTLGQYVLASLTQPQPPNTSVVDLAISTSDSVDPVIAGSELIYSLNINNNGPETATGVVFNNALSPNVTFVSASSNNGSCNEVENMVVCRLNPLTAAATSNVTIVVKPTEYGALIPAEGMTISNTAYVNANETDLVQSNNSVSENNTVLHDPNAAPTVVLMSPSNGNRFVGPANITVVADASDTDGSISQVDFYGDGELIGTGTATGSNQYSLEWGNVALGEHSIMAVVTDNAGKANTSDPVNITVNGLATVSITSPIMGQVVNRPVDVTISANATYNGGTVSKTDFYANGMLIGTVTAPNAGQYSFTWNNAPAGNHILAVVATDDSGIATISSPINITVNDHPEIALTTPTGMEQFTAPASINFTARASDIDGNVSKVAFYANGLQIASRSTVGAYDYNFTWSNAAAGTYILTAVATDSSGATTTSNPVTVTVNAPPTVSLTSPASGAEYVTPTNITILSSATDTDGTISKVEFYANGVLKGIGTLAGPNQYSFTWTGANTGDYALTAVATDNRGATTTSASVPIKVKSPALFVTGSTTLTSSDSVVKTRLEALYYVVTVKAASAAATADANGKALVVISSTVTPSAVGTKFRTVVVPVVTWESGLYANMGMTNTTNTSFGTTTKQTQVKIINPSHPMADGMQGQPGVTTTSGTLSWGKPNPNAVSVATIVGDTTKIVIFGYEQGAVMPGLTAPARRVGLFMEDTTAVSFSSPGQRLFDAAIKWATGRI